MRAIQKEKDVQMQNVSRTNRRLPNITFGVVATLVIITAINVIQNRNLNSERELMQTQLDSLGGVVQEMERQQDGINGANGLKFLEIGSTVGVLTVSADKLSIRTNALGQEVDGLKDNASWIDEQLASISRWRTLRDELIT